MYVGYGTGTLDATALAAMGALLMGLMVVSLLMSVLNVIGRWLMYDKAGEAGWKALVPVYSDYVLFRLVWRSTYFWVAMVLGAMAGMLYAVMTGSMSSSGSASTAVVVLSLLVALASVALDVALKVKTARAFGCGIGTVFGLVFLPHLFQIWLGAGSPEYVGADL